MRKILITVALAASALHAVPASAEVRLTINNGRVTLSAKDATVRQILAEWARVGQTKVVNAERIAGGALTLELANVPEREALEVILRSVSGYVAAPRAEMIANASQYDRIMVMPTSSPARPAAPAVAAPAFQQPQFTPPPTADDDSDDDQPAPPVPPNGATPTPPARGPVFNTFPQPRIPVPTPTPAAAPPPAAAPTAPVGVSTPGMVVPAPAQPGQPGAPNRSPDGLD